MRIKYKAIDRYYGMRLVCCEQLYFGWFYRKPVARSASVIEIDVVCRSTSHVRQDAYLHDATELITRISSNEMTSYISSNYRVVRNKDPRPNFLCGSPIGKGTSWYNVALLKGANEGKEGQTEAFRTILRTIALINAETTISAAYFKTKQSGRAYSAVAWWISNVNYESVILEIIYIGRE